MVDQLRDSAGDADRAKSEELSVLLSAISTLQESNKRQSDKEVSGGVSFLECVRVSSIYTRWQR